MWLGRSIPISFTAFSAASLAPSCLNLDPAKKLYSSASSGSRTYTSGSNASSTYLDKSSGRYRPGRDPWPPAHAAASASSSSKPSRIQSSSSESSESYPYPSSSRPPYASSS